MDQQAEQEDGQDTGRDESLEFLDDISPAVEDYNFIVRIILNTSYLPGVIEAIIVRRKAIVNSDVIFNIIERNYMDINHS